MQILNLGKLNFVLVPCEMEKKKDDVVVSCTFWSVLVKSIPFVVIVFVVGAAAAAVVATAWLIIYVIKTTMESASSVYLFICIIKFIVTK